MNGSLKFFVQFGRLLVIILLLGLLFAYAMFQGGFVSWFLFFSFAPILLYHLGLLFYPISSWHVTRRIEQNNVRSGNNVKLTITMTRKLPFPLYYCIVEELLPRSLNMADIGIQKYTYLNRPDELRVHRVQKKVVFPWFKRVIHVPYQISQVPRGIHELNQIRIRTGDIFGFVRKEHIFSVKDRLQVLPSVRKFVKHDRASLYEDGTAVSQTAPFKQTNTVTGIRDYVPGDRFSWINWKQTARKQALMTKEFELERQKQTLIISNHCYEQVPNPLAFEAVVEVTLSLFKKMQRQSSSLYLLSIGKTTTSFSVDQVGKQQALMNHLLTAKPVKSSTFIQQVNESLPHVNNNDDILIVTSELNPRMLQFSPFVLGKARRVTLYWIKSESALAPADHTLMEEFIRKGFDICLLSEQPLTKEPIEVTSYGK